MEHQVDKETLIKIIAIMGDDFPKGYELLELFIQKEAVTYANKTINELNKSI